MNGATSDPEVRTTNPPSRTSHMMIGKSQNFFRSFMNNHMSIKTSPIECVYHPERENVDGYLDDAYDHGWRRCRTGD
jgi:hypothetical protein